MDNGVVGIIWPTGAEFARMFLAAFLVAMVVIAVIVIVFWVLQSIGLMRMAKKAGFKDPWLAWIPGASLYLFMVLSGEKQRKLGIAYLFMSTLGFIVPIVFMYAGIIPMIVNLSNNPLMMAQNYGSIFAMGGLFIFGYVLIILLGIAVAVIRFILQYHIFKRFKPKAATVFTVLSIIFRLSSIFIFVSSFGTPDQVDPAQSQAPSFTPPPAA